MRTSVGALHLRREVMNGQPNALHPGAIGVEFAFGMLSATAATSDNFLMRKYNAFIEVDGCTYEKEGGVWHVVPLVPGWHLVRVFFRARPSFLSPDVGSQQLQVMVPSNGMARLRYSAGSFWPMSSATLVQVG